MLDVRILTHSDIELVEQNCTYCLTPFAASDCIVQCPVDSCGRWYHIRCWEANGNHCGFWECKGVGIPNPSNNNMPEQETEISSFNAILGRISIVSESNDNTTNPVEIHEIVFQDSDDENLSPTKHIEINGWEINLASAAKKLHLLSAYDRSVLPKVLGKYERTEYYWSMLGCFIILVAAIIFLAISGFWMLLR